MERGHEFCWRNFWQGRGGLGAGDARRPGLPVLPARGAGFLAPPAGAPPLRGPVLPGRVNGPDPAGRLDPDGRPPGRCCSSPTSPALSGASVDAPLAGVLVAVDARGRPGEPATPSATLLGGLTLDTGRVRRWMAGRGGCAVEGPTDWSRAAFANLGCLPQSERARWCVWKIGGAALSALQSERTGGRNSGVGT